MGRVRVGWAKEMPQRLWQVAPLGSLGRLPAPDPSIQELIIQRIPAQR